jgi:N-acyl-D-amino-acid deacylase
MYQLKKLPIALSLVVVFGSCYKVWAQIPMSGTSIPALQPIDRLITNLMVKYSVPGFAAGFVKDGRLVYVRGFGYANSNTLEVVQPDSLFRIASLSKSLTAAATLKLVEQGLLTLDQSAFALLNYVPPNYPGAAVDSRLATITVRNLLNHAGGWDRDTAINPDGGTGFDPTVNWTVRAAQDMGTTAPPDAATIVRWMIGKPLQFNPGTQYRYSNFGYTVLGRIIEKVTGTNYRHFVQELLTEADVSRMRIGGSRLEERLPGEVTYYDYPGSPLTTSIFPQDTAQVPWPYNFSYPTMDSHGGWVANAIELLRFVKAVDGRGADSNILSATSIASMIARPTPPWGSTQEPYYGMGWLVRNTPDNWWHDGSLPGTRTEMVRAGNGFTWVLLCNTRVRQDNAFFADMDNLGWQAQSAIPAWPTNDLFAAVLSYDAWKAKHFSSTELLDLNVSGDRADPDGDRIPNLIEYATGNDPRKTDHESLISAAIQTANGNDYLTIAFRRLLLANEVIYTIEVSDDLTQWRATGQIVGEPILNQDGTQTVTYRDETAVPSSADRFLRLRIARKGP